MHCPACLRETENVIMDEDVVARLRAAGCVFAEDEAEVLLQAVKEDVEPSWRLAELVGRRCAGEPLEHVVGWAGFCGLRIGVGPGVFVPRRRSEFLVELAVDLGRQGRVIVDLCCGSAPFATVLATRLAQAEVHAADIDAAQLVHARGNLAPFGRRARVHEGDLFDALPERLRGTVDLLVVNAPYVPSDAIDTLPAEARAYEPLASLDGGADGLAVHRRVAEGAPQWLAPRGHLLIETTEAQAELMLEVFGEAGLKAWIAQDQELEATVVIGRQPGEAS
ncbi:release factor glutamine methyltransferase [Catenulispora sp. MAP12-49]